MEPLAIITLLGEKMNDADFDVQRQRLVALSEKWIKPLGLGWWNIAFAYHRDDYVPLGTTARDDSLAKCRASWRYGNALISFNMPLVLEQDETDLEVAFLHELMHIFLNEMRWTADNSSDSLDHEERVASTLTKAFLWLRDSLVKDE